MFLPIMRVKHGHNKRNFENNSLSHLHIIHRYEMETAINALKLSASALSNNRGGGLLERASNESVVVENFAPLARFRPISPELSHTTVY